MAAGSGWQAPTLPGPDTAARPPLRRPPHHAAFLVTVTDNGTGLGPTSRRSGLANLRHRAETRGGTLTLETAETGGLALHWTFPLPNALSHDKR